MATDDLAAEIAAHRMCDASPCPAMPLWTGAHCVVDRQPWPCLVRRLADERERLRAEVDILMPAMEAIASAAPWVPRQTIADDALIQVSVLEPPAEPDAGGERR
jgi:hypothetical protein